MNKELKTKIMAIIKNNCNEWGDDLDIWKTTSEIASLLEAERKPTMTPDTITIHEAVKALVEYFEDLSVSWCNPDDKIYGITLRVIDLEPSSAWLAMDNGENSDAAVKVGLEDLFVSILMDAKEEGK